MKAEKQITVIRDVFERVVFERGGSLNFSAKFVCEGYKYSMTNSLLKKIKKTWQDLGIEAVFEKAGGASDVNEFAKWGMNVVDVGYGATHPHTTKEQVKISDMQLVSEFLINFLKS